MGRGSLYDVTSCLAAWSHVPFGGFCLWSHVPSGDSLSLVPCSFRGFSIQGSLPDKKPQTETSPQQRTPPQYGKERVVHILLECILATRVNFLTRWHHWRHFPCLYVTISHDVVSCDTFLVAHAGMVNTSLNPAVPFAVAPSSVSSTGNNNSANSTAGASVSAPSGESDNIKTNVVAGGDWEGVVFEKG